ncbi:MAG: PEP-CTERM sorting domain-containing protein [Phycisphaerae bacterium]|nr:PEP-CTERM sorting domain-containing protein [Phycisphaerae bacterium]
MKRIVCAGVAAFATASALGGGAPMLLWDNYLSPGAGHDSLSGLSADRQTLVPDAWTVEDMVLTQPVSLTEIRWIGLRATGSNIQYPDADVLLLDSQLNTVQSFQNLDFTSTVIGTLGGFQVYEGRVDLTGLNPLSLELAAGRYFFGARLVGNNLGQNFVATTGSGAVNGQGYGFFKSSHFGLPNWTPVGNVAGADDSEYSYQVYGTIIPEPVSLMMIGLGGIAMVIRRR